MNTQKTSALVTATGVLAAAAVASLAFGPWAADSAGAHSHGSGGAASAAFGHRATNKYFPLTAGLTTILEGTSDGEHLREVVQVTSKTKTITGVETTVVHDVVRRPDGSLAEKTEDWYATDDAGQVWYFGEDTATYDRHGHVAGREGSWQAGVHGAVAGIVMPADPMPSDAFRQEFLKGEAEDQAWVVQHKVRVDTPGGQYTDIIRTFEWTRLEPGVMSMKYYAAGLGIVSEIDIAGGDEHFWVVGHHR